MSLIGIPISPDECIGDSLTTINNAFLDLDTRTLNITGGGTANFNPTKFAFNGNGTTSSFSLTGIGTISTNTANYRVSLNGVVQELLLWHLGLHGSTLKAGGIEDAAEVGAPKVVQRIVVDCRIAWNAGSKMQVASVPMHAFVGGEYRPVHAGKSFLKKACGQAHNAMLGLEPCHELLAARDVIFTHKAEANEGVHFMDIAADGFAPLLQEARVAVRGQHQKMTFVAMGESPEHPIKHIPAARVAMSGNASGHVEKCGWHFRHRAARC